MVVPTVLARGEGLSRRHQGTEGSLSGNSETPPYSPWLCEKENAEGAVCGLCWRAPFLLTSGQLV